MSAPPKTQVFILTYCRDPEQLYGATLIFRTLRTGFPNAAVSVFDNRSVPEAAAEISSLCFQNSCAFYPLQREVTHPGFIEHLLARSDAGRVVFLDPDLVFWDSCEEIAVPEGRLFAGRRIPTFYDEYTETVTLERLHSSFLVFERLGELRERLLPLVQRHISYSPFAPVCFPAGGCWYRMDTAAGLYAALGGLAHAFGADELERYDHLLLGAQINAVHSIHPEDWAEILQQHRAAREGDLARLKGIYRFQDDYFARRAIEVEWPRPPLPWESRP